MRVILTRLWADRFIPAISRFLRSNWVFGAETRVQGVAETILHELKQVENINDKIREMYDTLVGDDFLKAAQLRMMTESWKAADWWGVKEKKFNLETAEMNVFPR